MGAEQSTANGGGPVYGFQVIKVEPGSPADKAKLSPFFDYICSVNGVSVVKDKRH